MSLPLLLGSILYLNEMTNLGDKIDIKKNALKESIISMRIDKAQTLLQELIEKKVKNIFQFTLSALIGGED